MSRLLFLITFPLSSASSYPFSFFQYYFFDAATDQRGTEARAKRWCHVYFTFSSAIRCMVNDDERLTYNFHLFSFPTSHRERWKNSFHILKKWSPHATSFFNKTSQLLISHRVCQINKSNFTFFSINEKYNGTQFEWLADPEKEICNLFISKFSSKTSLTKVTECVCLCLD